VASGVVEVAGDSQTVREYLEKDIKKAELDEAIRHNKSMETVWEEI
jgi:hypothetical protein